MPKDATPKSALKSKMTDEERVWVIALEDALKKSKEEFGRLTEFDIAVHAIIAKDQPSKALHRLRRLKKFKQRYSVRDDSTVYEAIKIVHAFVHAHPDFLQAFGKDASGRWVLFFRLEALTTTTTEPSKNNTDESFAALYYIFHAMQPDLDAIRNGTIWIGDFEGVTRRHIFPILNGARALCRDAYPIKVKDFPCLHSPPALSPVYAMCRPFLSQRVKQVMVMDCTPEVVRQHFPNNLLNKALGGTQRPADLIELLEENLKKRYDTQETFRLKMLG
jgi:hypothetical protein